MTAFLDAPPPWASAAGPDHYFRHLRLGGLPRATYTRSPSFLCEQQTPCRRRHQDDDASEDSNSRGSGFQGVHVGPLTPARSARWRRPPGRRPGRRRDAGSHWLPLLVLLHCQTLSLCGGRTWSPRSASRRRASDLPISAWDTCLSLSSSYVSCSFCCDRRGRVGLGRRPRRPPGRRAKPIPHQYIYPRVNGVLPLSLSIADFGAPESTRCLHAAISMVCDAFDLPSLTHFVSSSDSDRSKETSVG